MSVMPISAKLIKVSKFSAARLQLGAAIRLWFQDDDPVSVLTLAYASHEVLHRLYKNKGHGNLLYDTMHLPKDKREEFVQKLKLAPNFFKHAKRSGEEEGGVQFSTMTTIMFLFFSVLAVKKLVGNKAALLTDEELAFLAYCLIHEPSWFPENELKKGFAAYAEQQLVHIKRAEFIEAYVKAMGRRRDRGMNWPTQS